MSNDCGTILFHIISGPILEDECDCPQPSAIVWLKSNECPENYTQILQDLNLFPTVDFDKIRNDIIKKYNKPNSVSICHYVVKSNNVSIFLTSSHQ